MTIENFQREIKFILGKFNGSETSGHRTLDHNRHVGGAKDSQHLGWKAVDIVLDDWKDKDDAIFAAKVAGLFVLDEVATKNHLHLDDRFDM